MASSGAGAAAEPDSRESLRGRKVLVTGATGFIGSHLCGRLSAAGADVVGCSRRVQQGTVPSAMRWRALDVTEADQCMATVAEERPDIVFHLASRVSGTREPAAVLPMLHGNLLGAVHLLSALQQLGRGRFVQVGSQEEPSDGRSAPPSPYAAAKLGATTYCRMFASLYGVPVGVARVFMVYGPGRQDTAKLVPYVISRLLAGDTAELMSGARRIDWIHVEDVVRGLLDCAEALPEEWEVGRSALEVDLGSGVCHSVREVVELLVAATDTSARAVQFGALADRAGEVEVRAKIDETAERIGWRPTIELEDGLRRTVAWFQGEGARERPERSRQ